MNTLIKEILTGIFTAFLYAGIIFIYIKLSNLFRYRKTNKIMPLNKGVQIFVSSHQILLYGQSRTIVTAENFQGISMLLKLYSQFNIEPIIYTDKFINKYYEQSHGIEICIGSPNSNKRTQYYLKKYIPNIFNGNYDQYTILPNKARIIKITLDKALGKVKKDNNVIFLIYGYYTFDSVAAMHYFSKNFHLIKTHLSYDFCSILLQTSHEIGVESTKMMDVSKEITNPIRCPITLKEYNKLPKSEPE